MFLVGSGFGIIFVGFLCIVRGVVELKDIVTNGAVLGEQMYRVAIELVSGGMQAGVGLILLGFFLAVLGFGYQKLAEKENVTMQK